MVDLGPSFIHWFIHSLKNLGPMPAATRWALFQEDVLVSRTDKIPHPHGTPVPLGETDGEQGNRKIPDSVSRSECYEEKLGRGRRTGLTLKPGKSGKMSLRRQHLSWDPPARQRLVGILRTLGRENGKCRGPEVCLEKPEMFKEGSLTLTNP